MANSHLHDTNTRRGEKVLYLPHSLWSALCRACCSRFASSAARGRPFSAFGAPNLSSAHASKYRSRPANLSCIISSVLQLGMPACRTSTAPPVGTSSPTFVQCTRRLCGRVAVRKESLQFAALPIRRLTRYEPSKVEIFSLQAIDQAIRTLKKQSHIDRIGLHSCDELQRR